MHRADILADDAQRDELYRAKEEQADDDRRQADFELSPEKQLVEQVAERERINFDEPAEAFGAEPAREAAGSGRA